MPTTPTPRTTKTAWSHEGKDGRAELLLNLNDDPDDSDATVIRVSGRNQQEVARLLAELLNRSEFAPNNGA